MNTHAAATECTNMNDTVSQFPVIARGGAYANVAADGGELSESIRAMLDLLAECAVANLATADGDTPNGAP
jgi:hypothetical protein